MDFVIPVVSSFGDWVTRKQAFAVNAEGTMQIY